MPKSLLLVKVGSEDRPASDADIAKTEEKLVNANLGFDRIIVIHHAIEFDIFQIPDKMKTKTSKKAKSK